MKCQICYKVFENGPRSFSSHLQKTHKISSYDYTVKYIFNGLRPSCKLCESETRYISYSFKNYCKKHSKEAMKAAGKKGGRATAWNKGKTKYDDKRILAQSLLMSGDKNHFHGKSHSTKTIENISKSKTLTKEEYNRRIKSRSEEFEVLTPFSEYRSRQYQKLKLKCNVCSATWKRTLQSFERGFLCKKCFPFTISKAELDIGEYIEKILGLKIDRNRRNIISPYELDIYIPEKKIAIEYNGLYWHCEREQKGFDKKLHLKKLEMCLKKGIKLINIYSDEWKNSESLIKSMICSRLYKSPNKIFARKCEVREISSKLAKDFFEESHISGHVKAMKYYGLFHDDQLISAISMRKSFIGKHKNYIEIARFASKPFHSIPGSFSKLLKKAKQEAKQDGYKGILSYCNRRFGEGNVYLKNGFELVGNTKLDYEYTDGYRRYNRFKFRAQPNKPEKQVAKENRVYKIYGCGSNIYKLEF